MRYAMAALLSVAVAIAGEASQARAAQDLATATKGSVLVLKDGSKIKVASVAEANGKFVVTDVFGKEHKIGADDVQTVVAPVAKPDAPPKDEAQPKDVLETYWKSVTVDIKPQTSFITWTFKPDKTGWVRWTITVGDSTAKHRFYDIYFYHDKTRIHESVALLKDMKRDMAIEGKALVSPLDVTRIEVRLHTDTAK